MLQRIPVARHHLEWEVAGAMTMQASQNNNVEGGTYGIHLALKGQSAQCNINDKLTRMACYRERSVVEGCVCGGGRGYAREVDHSCWFTYRHLIA